MELDTKLILWNTSAEYLKIDKIEEICGLTKVFPHKSWYQELSFEILWSLLVNSSGFLELNLIDCRIWSLKQPPGNKGIRRHAENQKVPLSNFFAPLMGSGTQSYSEDTGNVLV